MWALLTEAFNDWFRHRGGRLGAALACYSVFSLGPLLLIVTSVAGLFFGADGRSRIDHHAVPLAARRGWQPGAGSFALENPTT